MTAIKKAIGIDICRNAVSFAYLQKSGSRIKVVRCGSVPLEQGIINNGLIQDPDALSAALKQFKISAMFQDSQAVLTVCAEPVLLQILNLPGDSPGQARKIIQNEVRQYAVLPLKDIEMDYCGLSSNAQAKRVLVGAGQSEHLYMAAGTFERKNNIHIMAVEPAVVAFTRVCSDKIIKSQKNKNIMLLLVRDETMSLCIFEKQKLEFLRTKKFETDIVNSPNRSVWLKNEIESVIQFYELDKDIEPRGWQTFIACCPENKYSLEIAGEIKSQILREDIEIIPFENSLIDVIADKDNKEVPYVAAGAAMKLLDETKSAINLNLLPRQIISIRKEKKEMLISANIAACLLVLLFLLVGLLSQKTINAGNDILSTKQQLRNTNIIKLAAAKNNIDVRARFVEENLNVISKTIEGKSFHNWGKLLAELAGIVPQTVLIQKLHSGNENILKIEGLAVNYEAVNSFVTILANSRQISSASLLSAAQDEKIGRGLINYSILCSMKK